MSDSLHTVRVHADDPLVRSSLRNLWNYRELLAVLSLRDYRVRFVQTRLGYLWAVLQPLILVAVLTFVFQGIIKVDTDGIPYPVFALSGQILWTYFSFSVTQGSQSLVQSQHIITKIWFPREVLPLSKIFLGGIDLLVGLLVLLISVLIYSLPIRIEWLFIPVAIFATAFVCVGISLWASALSVRFRDAQHAIPYFIQFLFFLTPVAFPTSALTGIFGEKMQWLAYLNPMAAPIDLMRFALFEESVLHPFHWISTGAGLFLLWSGWRYFQSAQRNLADTL